MAEPDREKERLLDMLVGIAFLLIAAFLIAAGLSFLPVIGLLVAVPMIFFAYREFRGDRRD